MPSSVTFRKTCRICEGKTFTKILDLGAMPPANAFLSKDKLETKETAFPLVLYFCRKCTLVQLRHVVNPDILFKNYPYQTSASAPLVAHFKKLAEDIRLKHLTSKNDLVVEIGSNDGSLLENLKGSATILGVDPANPMVAIAAEKGVPTLTAFFSDRTADEIKNKHGKAKVIIANNVLAHIDDIHSVFRGIVKLLTPNGVFVFEAHWVGNLLGEGGFDQSYHEHLCYFSLHAISALAKKFKLKVLNVTLVPIHGQSIQVTLGKTGTPEKTVAAFMKKERDLGLKLSKTYTQFAKKVSDNKEALLGLLKELRSQGKKIVGYGAPAKGNTLLNYLGVGIETLDFITDTTPSKQGLYAPGSHIPILPPNVLVSAKPDYILLLSWNYAEEILKKEGGLREAGVKFIIPVPKVKII